MNNHLLTFLFLLICQIAFTQDCTPDEIEVQVIVQTDSWGYETSWEIIGTNSNTTYHFVDYNVYDNLTVYDTTLCLPNDECYLFNIYDSYGDGIFDPGHYEVIVNGDQVAWGQEFGTGTFHNFNCPPGTTCDDALDINVGAFTTIQDDTWYAFTPDSTGTYHISTCDDNTCDTKIWVYDACNDDTNDEQNLGTIFYNDNNDDCGDLAFVEAYLAGGVTYYIRIGDAYGACGTTLVNWTLEYAGPVIGCTDPMACNYNPLATIDDGSCLQPGDPDCPNGPDLLLRQDVLESSIYLDVIDANDECLVNEGCINGLGMRDVVRFTTHIQNIGDLDYVIGEPVDNSDQFTFDNCHGHYHYDGYAEYILFDSEGTLLPIGFKNGFCVLDLECSMGGDAQYGCSYMGISAACGDIYDSSLPCQWVDITDVADGDYHLVTRVNWDNAPDALGNIEKDSINNWAQVCINLDRSSGELVFTVLDDCEPYVDCAGDLYGNAQPDCTGECGGTTLMGDLDANAIQEMDDAENYVISILGDDITPTACNDMNADDDITVYDAALLAGCLNLGNSHTHDQGGIHDHCSFPDGLVNIFDTVALSIVSHDASQQYIEIGMENPSCNVVAYQFEVSGLIVINVENLVDPNVYPINPMGNNGGMIIGLSYEDSTIIKNNAVQPLCRIYYNEITADEVCISNIVDIINDDYQQTITRIDGPCVQLVPTIEIEHTIEVEIDPNPFSKHTLLRFNNPAGKAYNLRLSDVQGRTLRNYSITGSELLIERDGLASGVYLYRLEGADGVATGRLVVE